MSIECEGCYKTVRQPDTPWYAGTRFSPLFNQLCGTCVAVIPPASRRQVSVMQDFEITFGPLVAEIGLRRNYQGYNSKIARPVFAVSAKAIFDNIPLAEDFLQELYPYWCMDWFCADLNRCNDSNKTLFLLWNYREALKAWLSLANPPLTNIERFDDFRFEQGTILAYLKVTGKELTPQEKNETDDLLIRVHRWEENHASTRSCG